MRYLRWFIWIGLLCYGWTAMAQTKPETTQQVILYDEATGELLALTNDGLQSIATVNTSANWIPASAQPIYFKLSPSGTQMVFALRQDGIIMPEYYVTDITTGACCIPLNPQDDQLTTMYEPSTRFSPDGTQLAVSYHNSTDQTIPPQLVVFDLATGEVVARLLADDVLPYPDGGDTYLLNISAWTEQGIGVFASPCCFPVRAGVQQFWIPAEGQLSPPDYFFNLQNETLANGESVRVELNPAFPNAEGEGLELPYNVVVYESLTQPAEVIYWNVDNLFVTSAHWVADGQGIVVTHKDGEAYVLFRDGTRLPNGDCFSNGACDAFFDLRETRFVAGTADGWIVRDSATNRYLQVRLAEQGISTVAIADYRETFSLVARPTLAGCCEGVFPIVEQP